LKEEEMHEPKIKRILVAVDFSEITGAVVGHGLYLAKAFGAELKLLHVVHIPPFAEATTWMLPVISTTTDQNLREEIAAGVEKELTKISDQCAEACPNVEAIIREGIPFQEIIDCAKEIKADLIILGTHGRTGLSRAIIGSVAERVVRTASCSVFCINPSVMEKFEE
jgi:universal stress protein A